MMKQENNNYIIYKAVNTKNGCVYIGATTNSIKQRKLDHSERAIRGEKGKFQEAIVTYGLDAFKWEQIDTATNINELADKEKKFIYQYNSKEKGYNGDIGGGFKKNVYQYNILDGKLVNSYTSLTNAAKTIDISKQLLSSVCLGISQTYNGFIWSYTYKEPYVRKRDKRPKEVLQYSLEGEFIASYSSLTNASKITGFSKTCISKVCRGERKQTSGFIWKYL